MATTTQSTVVPTAGVLLEADVRVPASAVGVVLFAHGSGSSRLSPRNRSVAQTMHAHQLATVLVDLLTAEEAGQDALDGRLRFDIGLLAERLTGIIDWTGTEPMTAQLPLGLFGASTGAAAALFAAAVRPGKVRAVVSRGGRVDLAATALPDVSAPTLLIVGERDVDVLRLNRQARAELPAAALNVVPGAGHLFEQPGTLEQVADLAANWLYDHCRHSPPPAA
jgi:pimeloyl-ACP methyl ester carboxylesterase